MNSNITMNSKRTVWIATFRFEDRHGESGADVLGVYDSEEKAKNACADNAEMYLGDFGAIRDDGTIDPDALLSVDDEPVKDGLTLEQARYASTIKVDEDTWCTWDFCQMNVE